MLYSLDRYVNKYMSRIEVPDRFKPVISVVYPPNNHIEFERWIDSQYDGCNTERIYLPVYWTGYYVNNDYGNDRNAIAHLQGFLDSLDESKKYWTVVQYDDSILNEVSHLDILRFEMSKNYGYPLPLIGQDHPYTFPNEPKK